MFAWKRAAVLDNKHARAYLQKVLERDEAIDTPADAARIIDTWDKEGILSAPETEALKRSINQTRIAIMKGKVAL